MRTLSVVLLGLLSIYSYAQVIINHNHQTIPDQKLQQNQRCSGDFQINDISTNSYITISSNYEGPHVYVQASLTALYDDKLAELLSTRMGPQTETLRTPLNIFGKGTKLFARICRDSTDTATRDFTLAFDFTCNERYYPVDHTFACTPCPANSTRPLVSPTLGISSCTCDPFTYLLQNDPRNPQKFQCIDCPYGASCAGGSTSPEPIDGYYPLNNNGQMIYVKCPFPNSCAHSTKNGTALQVPVDITVEWPIWLPPIPITELLNVSKTNYNVTTQALCAQGYSGHLCGQCVQGYYRLGVRCLSCGTNRDANNLLIVVFIALLLLMFALCVPMTILNTHVSSFGIVLNFIQVSAMFSLFNLKWDEGILTFFDLLSIFNLNPQVFRPECISPVGYYSNFMIMFFIPAFYFVFSFLPLFGWFVCFRFIRQSIFTKINFVKVIQWTVNSYFSVIIVHGYIALSTWTLTFYTCDSYGEYLDQIPKDSSARSPRHLWYSSQICSTDSSAFGGYLIFFYVGLGVYVLGVPFVSLVLWYWLVGVSRWRARTKLKSNEEKEAEKSKELLEGIGISSPNETSPNKTELTVDPSDPDDESKINQLANELKNSMASVIVEGRFSPKVIVGFEASEGIIRTFGSVYHRYRPSRFWWELIILIRKLGVVLCFAYLEQQPVIAVVLSSLVILFSLIMNLYFQPYRKHTSNILESVLLLIQYCMLVLSLMFYASQYSDGLPFVGYSSAVTTTIVTFITIGLIISVIVLVLEMLYEFRRTWYLPTRERMRELAMKNRARNIMKKLKILLY